MARTDYATVAEVESLTWSFTTDTTPTTAEVTAKLTNMHDRVDNNIYNRYSTPVTDTESIATLKDIVLAFMVDWVYRCKYGFKDIPEAVTEARKDAKETLLEIRRGGIALQGATQQSTGGLIEYNSALKTSDDTDFNTNSSTDDYGKDTY